MSPRTPLKDHIVAVPFPGCTWGWLFGAALNAAEQELADHPEMSATDRRGTAVVLGMLLHAFQHSAPATLDESMTEGSARLRTLLKRLGGPFTVEDEDFFRRTMIEVPE